MSDALYIRLPNWVGDACMCLPALALLNNAGLPLVLCGRGWARDLFAALPVRDFVEIDRDRRASRQRLAAVRRQDRDPVGLLFTNSLSSAFDFWRLRIPSAGYRGDGRGLLLRWPEKKGAPTLAAGAAALPPEGAVPPWGGPAAGPAPTLAAGAVAVLHEVEVFRNLAIHALRAWGCLPHPLPPLAPTLDLPLTAGHEAGAREALAQAGIAGPFVLLSPTATGLHHGRPKAWPHFGALGDALRARGHECVICPPAHEADQARAAVPSARVLPPLGLGAFAALTRHAALVICNDSGTSHVAAAAGARQITLFGVTRRERTGPWSPTALCLGSDQDWPTPDAVLDAACGALAPPPIR